MSFDAASTGVAYGDESGACGPKLVVAAGRPGSHAGSSVNRRVFMYDGARWQELASIPASDIQSMTSVDPDGAGPEQRVPAALVRFTQDALSFYQAYVLRGGVWSTLGPALRTGGDSANPVVPTIVGWDPDGSDGPATESLYLTYRGEDVQGDYRAMVARWNGEAWERRVIDARTVRSTRVLDLDGDGPQPPRLVVIGAVGQNSTFIADPIMVFDGNAWTIVPRNPSMLSGEALDATVRSDGTLLMGSSDGANVWLSKLTPSGWVSALGSLRSSTPVSDPPRLDLISIDDGDSAGPDRVYFSPLGSSVAGVGVIGELALPTDPNATAFFAPTPGVGFNGPVREAMVLVDGSLLVSGGFTSVDGVAAARIARRDVDGAWHAVGAWAWSGAPNSITQLTDGSFLAIDSSSPDNAGYVMRFDGEAWTRFRPTGVDIAAKRLLRSDNDVLTFVHLVVGGSPFQSNACGLAQWRGDSFVPMDCVLVPTFGLELVALANGDVVRALAPNGSRPETLTGLMRWDGYTWSAMGEGNQYVTNLRVASDGTLLGLRGDNRISRWNGSLWIADPVDGLLRVNRITSFDVVGDEDIVAFGSFVNQTGVYSPRNQIVTPVARVTGTYWEDPIGTGTNELSNTWRAVGLQDGSALILGNMKLNFASAIHTHFGMFQVSACNTCSACMSDWDESGAVDFGDVAAFFMDYEQGNRCADVDNSTGVDGTDMAIFFEAFDAGGC